MIVLILVGFLVGWAVEAERPVCRASAAVVVDTRCTADEIERQSRKVAYVHR